MPKPVIQVYTREGCTLCDDAWRDLERLAPQWDFGMEAIDINGLATSAPEEYASLDISIPVVKLNGREICRHRLDRTALRKALDEHQMSENQVPQSGERPAAQEPPIRGFLVVLGIAVLVVVASFVRFPKQGGSRFPSPGDLAPQFEGRFLTGETFSLESERGKRVIILNFWASWCDPCIKEMPDLEKLYQKTQASGVELVAINQDSREVIARDFTKRLNISMPVIWDQDGRIAKKFGTFRFPETYVIDLEGRIGKKIFGPVDWASDEVVNYVLRLAEKGGRVEGETDPLVGGSREQASERTRDVRSSPN